MKIFIKKPSLNRVFHWNFQYFSCSSAEMWNKKYVFQLKHKENEEINSLLNRNTFKDKTLDYQGNNHSQIIEKHEKSLENIEKHEENSKKLEKIKKIKEEIGNLMTISKETGVDIELVKWNHIHKENFNMDDTIIDKSLVNEYKIYENSTKESIEMNKINEVSQHNDFITTVKDIASNENQMEFFNKTGIVIKFQSNDAFIKSGLDSYNYLRKYRDRDYKVDINEVLNRDLWEKQRVYDSYIEEEENKEKLTKLIGSYENMLVNFIKTNKYDCFIYENPYFNKEIFKKSKKSFYKKLSFTCLLTFLTSVLVNPIINVLFILLYKEIFEKALFFNSLIHEIRIDSTKNNVLIRKFNFLGLERPVSTQTKIQINSQFKLFKEKYIFNKNSLVFNRKNQKNPENYDENKEKPEKKGDFHEFYEVMFGKNRFFLPSDAVSQSNKTNEELTLLLLNGEIEKIAKFDYSQSEKEGEEEYNDMVNKKKEYCKRNYRSYQSKEDIMQMDYCRYKRNWNFSQYKQGSMLKDITNGYYIDNGYK